MAEEQAAKGAPAGVTFDFGGDHDTSTNAPQDQQSEAAQPKGVTFDWSKAKPLEQPSQAPEGVQFDWSKAKPLAAAPQATIGPRPNDFHTWLENVQADVKNGSATTWVGSLLSKMGAKGTNYGVPEGVGEFMGGPVIGPAKALAGGIEVKRAAAPIVGDIATGTSPQAAVAAHPAEARQAEAGVNKVVGGTFQTLGPAGMVLAPEGEALAVVGPAMVAQHLGTQAALQMGADPDTAELVGNVAGVVAGHQIHSTLNPVIERFGVAVNNRTAAETEYINRSRNLETARAQAAEAQQRAVFAAQMEESQGQYGSPEKTIAARQLANEAAKNVGDAQKAFDQASKNRADATIEVEKLHRKITSVAEKAKAAEYERTASDNQKAMDLVKRAVPSKGANRYSDEDMDRAFAHVEEAKGRGEKVKDLPDFYNAVEQGRQGIEDNLFEKAAPYKDEPVTTNPEKSPKVIVAQKLAEMAKVDGNFDNAMDTLGEFNVTDPTVGEAKDLITKLNNYQRATMKGKNNWDIYNMIETDPQFAARFFMADALRDALHDNLEGHGIEGSKEARNETAALVRVRDAVGAQIRANRGGTAIRGSGSQSAIRSLVAKLVGKAGRIGGAGVGAEVAGVPGAIAGAAAGEMAAEPVQNYIAPRDLTRDEHIEKATKYKMTARKPAKITGEGTPAVIPNEPIPPMPKAVPQSVELTPRENTDLHAELATHYNVTDLDSVSYQELENDLRRDIQVKRDNGQEPTPAEKKLFGQVTKADVADRAKQAAAGKENAALPEDEEKAILEAARKKAAGEKPEEIIQELVSKGQGEDSMLVSHSPSMKATAAPMPISGLPEGVTSEDAHIHEWAHAAIGAVDGLQPEEIRSDLHPKSERGAGATTVFNSDSVRDVAGNVDPELLGKQEVQWLTQKMAGPASHEVFRGMPREDVKASPVARADFRQARAIVREVHPEFTASQVEAVVDAAYDRARDFLTKPPITDRIRANAAVREEGLPQTHHASFGRVNQFAEDIRRAHNEYTGTDTEPDGGGAGEGGEKAEKPAAKAGEEKNAGRDKGRGGRGASASDEESGTARGVSESRVTKAANPNQDVVEGAGLKYKGELVKGSDVHMFEHPDHPGKTAALQGPLTEEAVKAKMAGKLKEFGVQTAPEKQPFTGTHYSTVPAENGVLAGANRGKANAGSEAARVALGAEPGVYAYREGTRPEAQIGGRANKYTIRGEKAIADISGAQKGLFEDAYQKAKEAAIAAGDNDTVAGHKGLNAAETALKNAGYDGYEHAQDYPGNTFLFGDQKIHPSGEEQLAAHEAQGGSTFTPEGKNLAGEDLYSVGAYPNRTLQVDKLTPEILSKFKADNADVLGSGDHAVGTWKDPDTGKTVLDITKTYKDRAEAVKAGEDANQKGIYHLGGEGYIPTGGTGEGVPVNVGESQIVKSPKGSSVPLMQNPLPVKGTMEGGEVGTLDLTKALNQFSRKQLPALKPGSEPAEMVARAKNIAEDEAKYQLAQSKTGTEWYTTEMKDHDKLLQGIRPELGEGPMTDTLPDHPVNLTLFKAAEAILSSGQKPYRNVKSAVMAWDLYKETGQFPPTNPATGKSWGPRNVAAYGNAFDAVNKLIADKGEKGAADWLLSEHPVSELREYHPGVAGKATDVTEGSKILGEKRGPFMQNLHGVESKFTADMWVSRTWNRWMGTLDLDPRIKDNKTTSVSDSPRNNTERALMKESFEKTAKKLNLTTSSLQAVLWYYEQALYRAHGLPVESWSFSDAAKRVADEHNAAPESEQTGFNFGANKKEEGGLGSLGNLPVQPSKFVNLRAPVGQQ